MSVAGFTQASSAPSASPATSSSHQPPAKVLKAFEDAESDVAFTKPLIESTDDELNENIVQAVPNVPEREEAHDDLHSLNGEGGEAHDADVFVPNPDRNSTLGPPAVDLGPIPAKPEVFEIGAEDAEEKEDDEALPDGRGPDEAKREEE